MFKTQLEHLPGRLGTHGEMIDLRAQHEELQSDPAECHVQATRGTGLRIGLDARLLGDHLTGVGYYVSELCKEVDHILPRAEFFLHAPWDIKVVGIKALGYVPEEVLPALYSCADVFILPSLDEGFGIPVLEARACQTKIITSHLAELPEAGGDRPIYIRPDTQGIRAGIMAALAAEPPSKPDRLWTWESSSKILADALDPKK